MWKKKESKFSFDDNDSILSKLSKINGIEDIHKFLNPSIDDTHSFNLLNNIDIAVDMISKAILNKEKIVIYYDADQDGCESGATLYRYLKRFTENVELIHVQRRDGHGLSLVEDKIPNDTELLIAVDSSTNDHEASKRISEKGIPILIIDHHDFEGINNPFATIVNPKMPDCKYPNKEASGTLVTFKVCCALDEYFSTDYADDLVDLAGFSLLADVMSTLEPENRYYIKNALENPRNLGMRILIETLKINYDTFDSIEFLFSVAPCITAITRMDKLEVALQLLISDNIDECKSIAKQLVKANEHRKQLQKDSIDLVKTQINPKDKCIVIVDSSIGKSFNGVVCQSIASLYQRPVIVLGESEKQPKQYSGSFRSYGGFDIKGYLKGIKSAIFAAGHSEAGGTACWKDNIELFKKEINAGLKDVTFDQSITYDLEFSLEEINEDLINSIKQFYKICGKDLSVSKFLIKDVFPISKKALGSGDTLKVELCSASDSWFLDEDDYDTLNPSLTMMKFKTNELFIEEFPVYRSIDIIGTLNTNVWIQYKPKYIVHKSNQIFIESYRFSE